MSSPKLVFQSQSAIRSTISNGVEQSLNETIFGVNFSTITLSQALRKVMETAASPYSSSIFFVNAHCLNVSCHDYQYRQALLSAELILPDGIGVEVGCKMKGRELPHNLNGTDLFPRLCRLFETNNQSIFLLGAKPGTAEKVKNWIYKNYPKLKVAGYHHGHFSSDESEKICQKINHSGADILFVAMGVPRQELWIKSHQSKLATRINIAVGGLFEFYSDNIPRAPGFVRRLKMEWVWRLYQEPKRMWRRYIIGSFNYLRRLRKHHKVNQRLTHPTRLFSKFEFYKRRAAFFKHRLLLLYRTHGYHFLKRLIDIIGSSVGLIFLAPILLVVAIAIRIDSKGPVFFLQKRVGRAGKPFTLIKLRTMSCDAEEKLAALKHLNEKSDGIMFKMKNDPRVTAIGKFLRKYSIDELPQLFNVLIGEMSLVGPRPALYSEVEQYDLAQRHRIDLAPGLASEWVIAGRDKLSFQQQAELDLEYYYQHSITKDLSIILRTIPAVIFAKGAS